ncbi:MAG: EscU/YscU/HrcU family type III secretion system export apparatus switch protein [Oscillospiraceae bacterium]|nr:EscU/YscU/HrcU family type III secretion system export apparatus switch protein [Oscillospiraceae bacterium]
MSKFDKKAVALKYDMDNDFAPIVVASGYGSIAEKIIDIAEKQGIPVYRDDSVSSMLCMLDVGKSIPPELYGIIAKIYCSILMTAEKYKGINTDGN